MVTLFKKIAKYQTLCGVKGTNLYTGRNCHDGDAPLALVYGGRKTGSGCLTCITIVPLQKNHDPETGALSPYLQSKDYLN